MPEPRCRCGHFEADHIAWNGSCLGDATPAEPGVYTSCVCEQYSEVEDD